MDPKTYKFDTLSLHAGYQPSKNAGSRQVPIYQTTSYMFDDVDHAAACLVGSEMCIRDSKETAGCFATTFSTSTDEIFSPPEIIISFDLSFILSLIHI